MAEHSYTVSEKVLRHWVEQIERAMTVADKPCTARALARVCAIKGVHETLRRRVREAVTYGRESRGLRICANSRGYWLARDASEWARYTACVAAGARFTFVKLARTKAAVTERMSGQGRFDFGFRMADCG